MCMDNDELIALVAKLKRQAAAFRKEGEATKDTYILGMAGGVEFAMGIISLGPVSGLHD